MDIGEFIIRINQAKQGLPRLILLSYIEIAEDANGIIKSRVIEQGINAEGTSFTSIRQYSEAYLKRKQHAGTGGTKLKRVRKGKTADKSGNIIQGRYRGFVDFTLSGSMWKNTGVLVDQAVIDESGIKISVAPRNEDEMDKMVGNVSGNGKWPGRGEILELADGELQRLAENFEINLQTHFESFFQ